MDVYVAIDENMRLPGFGGSPPGRSLIGVFTALKKAEVFVRKHDAEFLNDYEKEDICNRLDMSEDRKGELWTLFDNKGYSLYSIEKTTIQ